MGINLVPYSDEFERAVIVGSLADPLLVPRIQQIISAEDFFKAQHKEIFATIETIGVDNLDSLTVEDKLKPDTRDYFKTLVEDQTKYLPGMNNIMYYAETIKGKSQLRAGIELGRDITSLCYQPDALADETLRQLEERFSVFLQRKVLDNKLDSSSEAFKDFMANLGKSEADPNAVRSGFSALDLMLHRLEGLIVLAGRPGLGKGQPFSAKVLTPKGFVTMGSLKVGDPIIGRDGKTYAVEGIFPLGVKPIYKISTTDGRSTECTDDHLWLTETRNERRAITKGWSVKTTEEIRKTITRNDNDSPNHALPTNEPIEFETLNNPLTIDPYLMGLILGDGGLTGDSVHFTNSEPDIQNRFTAFFPVGHVRFNGEKEFYIRAKSGLKQKLIDYGLFGHYSYQKFIPTDYLRAKPEERLALLRGLLDTDGNVCDTGIIEYGTSAPQLKTDVEFLVRSLGGRVSTASRIPYYTYKGLKRPGKEAYRLIIRFPHNLVPVSSVKHLSKWAGPNKRQEHVSIKSVEYIGDKEAQCIKVSAPDQLYVTDDFIVTHNTAFAINVARNVAENRPVLFFSLEQTREQIFERMLAAEAEVNLEDIRTGAFRASDFDTVGVQAAERRLLPLMDRIHVDERAEVPTSYISSVARQKKYEWGDIGLIIIDYLHIIKLNNKPVVDALGDATKEIRALGKELGCPVLLLAQLSRQTENRTEGRKANKRPELSDLRSSGEIEQSADIVIFLYRDSYYGQAGLAPDDDLVEVIVKKNRSGRQGIATMRWLPKFVKFKDF